MLVSSAARRRGRHDDALERAWAFPRTPPTARCWLGSGGLGRGPRRRLDGRYLPPPGLDTDQGWGEPTKVTAAHGSVVVDRDNKGSLSPSPPRRRSSKPPLPPLPPLPPRRGGGRASPVGAGSAAANGNGVAIADIVGGPVEVEHPLVDILLAGGIQPEKCRGDRVADMPKRLLHAFAPEPGLVIPQFDRLGSRSTRTRRDGRPAEATSGEETPRPRL